MEFDDGLDCYSMEVLLLHARAKHIRDEMLEFQHSLCSEDLNILPGSAVAVDPMNPLPCSPTLKPP